MSANAARLSSRALSSIPLPATHDSGAVAGEHHEPTATTPTLVDGDSRADLRRWCAYPLVGPILTSIVRSWAVTQGMSMHDQLECGVRAFDLRLAKNAADK